MTINKLSAYQIEQLKGHFTLCNIENIGITQETGEIIIEYIPRYSETRDFETKIIPRNKPEHYEQSKTNL
jgi:hypothetical protein